MGRRQKLVQTRVATGSATPDVPSRFQARGAPFRDQAASKREGRHRSGTFTILCLGSEKSHSLLNFGQRKRVLNAVYLRLGALSIMVRAFKFKLGLGFWVYPPCSTIPVRYSCYGSHSNRTLIKHKQAEVLNPKPL